MVRLHPLFNPSAYVAVAVEATDAAHVRMGFRDCPAAHEGDALTWFTGLGDGIETGLRDLVQAFDPGARLERVPADSGELHAFSAGIDPAARPVEESAELTVAKISTGATFSFRRPTGQVLPVKAEVV
jgi:hypothetical protein